MRKEVIGDATLYLGDCMDILPTLGNVDAVVTDPPYGILNLQGVGSTLAVRKSRRQQGSGKLKGRLLNTSDVSWDIAPSDEVFNMIRRISRNQIIWGGNYFNLPPTRAVLVWDKEQPWENFSQVEVAWSSMNRPAAIFRESAKSGTPNKLHPTQKPLSLMLWCIDLLPAMRSVMDPFMGSGTTGVACAKRGLLFVGIEREPRYFDIACRRIEEAYRQADLFVQPAPAAKPTQASLFGGDAA